MNKHHFHRLPTERQRAMRNVLHSASSLSVLEEGLQKILDPKIRESVGVLSAQGKFGLMGVIYTYGKRSRAKLSLNKPDARALLDLSEEIRKNIPAAAEDPSLGTKILHATAAILFDNQQLESVAVEHGDTLVKILCDIDPDLRQPPLF